MFSALWSVCVFVLRPLDGLEVWWVAASPQFVSLMYDQRLR